MLWARHQAQEKRKVEEKKEKERGKNQAVLPMDRSVSAGPVCQPGFSLTDLVRLHLFK